MTGGGAIVMGPGILGWELILGRGLDIERVESFSVGTVKQSLSFFVGGRIDAVSFDAATFEIFKGDNIDARDKNSHFNFGRARGPRN